MTKFALPIGKFGSKLLPMDGNVGNPIPIIGGVGNKIWFNDGGSKFICGNAGRDPKFNVGGGGRIVFSKEGRLKDDNEGGWGRQIDDKLGGEGKIILPKLGGEGKMVLPKLGGEGKIILPKLGGDGSIMLPKLGGGGNIVLPKLGGDGKIVFTKLGGNGWRFTLAIEGGFNVLLFVCDVLLGDIFISKHLIVSIFNLGLSLIGF